jgi:hypothetical protein
MAAWGGALAALVAVSLLVMSGLLNLFEQRTRANGAGAPTRAERADFEDRATPSPTARQLARAREEQRRRLEEYGWVDRRQNVAHIPIERAMQLLLDRGLPVRETASENA